MSVVTLGRRPTLGEVLDYYTREDFVHFAFATCRKRPVVMVIPERHHWEPNWAAHEIATRDLEQFGRRVLELIVAAFPGIPLDERPSYYPSFHQSVWKWPDAVVSVADDEREATARIRDCVFEADLPTWRASFGDVLAIVDLMEHHGMRYRQEFSGHRSLHITIPAEALPPGYRGRAANKLVGRLIRWSGSQAHCLPQITRMPYSLNEDTGLVCTPIARGELPGFRPWQANIHIVHVEDPENDGWSEADQERTVALIDALQVLEAEPGGASGRWTARVTFAPDRGRIRAAYRDKAHRHQAQDEVGQAWSLLTGKRDLGEGDLLRGLESSEPDARWLTLEAFFLHGRGLSREGFHRLLEVDGEYARPAALDVLLRFADDVFAELVHVVSEPDRYPAVGAMVTFLLTQDDRLRDRVLAAIVEGGDRPHDALIAAACVAGAIVGDWPQALDLVAPMRDAPDLPDRARVRLAALDLMSEMGGWDKREEAKKATVLAALGPEVTDLLLVAAGSPHRCLRRGVVSALADLADVRAVELLIRSLADDYTKVRRRAVGGLVRIGEPAVDPLIEATASDQVRIRRYAVFCLGGIGAPRGKPAVLQALDDAEAVVRRQAIRALVRLATIDDIERLKQVLREETWELALHATEILGALGEKGQQAMETMACDELNLAAAYYVALQGNPRGREILVKGLEQGPERREIAAEFLRELGDARCVPFFAQELETIVDWRGAFIAHELGRIGTPQAVRALIQALSREYKLVRRGAVRGLAEAKDAVAVEPLIQCLGDEDSKARGLAADALVEMGEAAVQPIRDALHADRIPSKHGQNLAHRVLHKLGAHA
jgi:HEAT repeat protein